MTSTARALLGSAHPGPALAVTLLAGLLAVASDAGPVTVALVVGAVLSGQLSIGWSNDLVDLRRDLAVGRDDKPLVRGDVAPAVVRLACGLAVAATVSLSLATGWVAGLVQLVVVASGWVYNLGAKSSVWSWLPYAVAFGALPVFVLLAADAEVAPPVWLGAAGALLGVGAHLVNVLPDLEDDAATGVRGLPHRLGARWTPLAAAGVLVLASVTIVVAGRVGPVVGTAGLVVVAVLGGVAARGRGRAPFRAAIGIALVGVVLLVVAGGTG